MRREAIAAALRHLAPKIPAHEFGAVVDHALDSEGLKTAAPDTAAWLSLVAYAVVWVNPLKGHPDYEPLAGGMRAALPHVDRFLPGHNLASLEDLAGVLAGIERRHAA